MNRASLTAVKGAIVMSQIGVLHRLFAVSVLSVIGLAMTASGQTITDIGTLQPTGGTVESLGISADGTAVTGYSTLAGGTYRAIRWTESEGLQNLGVVPRGLRSFGFAISGDGAVVTGMSVVSGGGHVFRWTASGNMEDLGTIPAQNVSYGYAISASGSLIGGGPSSAGVGHGFVWSAGGGLSDIGLLPGAPTDASSSIFALSSDGSFGAGVSGSSNGNRAILWSNERTVLEDLGVLPGGAFSEALAISADGSAITGSSDSASGRRAFLWKRGTGMVDLGVLPGRGGPEGKAISADGSVVVGSDDAGAFLWTSPLGMVDLHAYLVSRGVTMTGWVLTSCNGISADGTAMAGSGRFNGASRGWVVRGLPPVTCAADFDAGGTVAVPDIFAFLAAWFAQDARADFDRNGTIAVPDIFAFLAAWFAGCP